MTNRVCVFEGEGAAPEAMEPTVELLEVLDIDIDVVVPPVEPHTDELSDGRVPEAITREIHDADSVLFGAAQGAGGWKDYMPILKYLRTELGGGLPANVRRVRYFEGANSPFSDPEGIDYAVVRENIEGAYFGPSGIEGDLDEIRTALADGHLERAEPVDSVGPGTYALRVISERNIRRLANIVCEYAERHYDARPVTITCATKSNILSRTDGLFDDVLEETVREHDAVTYEHLHVDNAGAQLVTDPQRFDLVVTTNANGDILSDIGGATVGGLGLAHSGCFGEEATYFEPVHGTAPDIEGEGIINPSATILSAAMMLQHLGYDEAANRLETAVERVYSDGEPLTPDQGGSASTTEMAAAVRNNL